MILICKRPKSDGHGLLVERPVYFRRINRRMCNARCRYYHQRYVIYLTTVMSVERKHTLPPDVINRIVDNVRNRKRPHDVPVNIGDIEIDHF